MPATLEKTEGEAFYLDRISFVLEGWAMVMCFVKICN